MPYKTIEEFNRVLAEYNQKLEDFPEIWKPLEYKDIKKDYYLISNHGRIFSNIRNRIMKPINSAGGRNQTLYGLMRDNNKLLNVTASRLVALTFIPIPKDLLNQGYDENVLFVMHVNGIGFCNATFNLKWVLRGEQISNANNKGMIHRNTCENTYHTIYTNDQIHYVCKLLENGLHPNDISNQTGIEKTVIHNIQYGRSWREISRQYKIDTTSRIRSPKLTQDVVESICRDLQSGLLTLTEIANKYNTTKTVVSGIRNNKYYKTITSKFMLKLTYKRPRLAVDIIHKICKDLERGDAPQHEIAKKYGTTQTTICNIKRRNCHKKISKDYNF